MLDIKFIRENPDAVKENIKKKFQEQKLPLVDQVLELDAENRRTIQEAQELRTARNAKSKQVGVLMGQSKKDPSKLAEAEALKAEVLQMQSVNFKKYADIIVNLQMNNTFYWLIKHFDDRTLDHIRSRFDQTSGLKMIETFHNLQSEAIRLQGDGVSPESEKGQAFAEAFWQMVTEFTGGDREILSLLMEVGKFDGLDNEWKQKQTAANAFIEPALSVYFTNLGVNPFEEGPN